jgi:hypothetical protein
VRLSEFAAIAGGKFDLSSWVFWKVSKPLIPESTLDHDLDAAERCH